MRPVKLDSVALAEVMGATASPRFVRLILADAPVDAFTSLLQRIWRIGAQHWPLAQSQNK